MPHPYRSSAAPSDLSLLLAQQAEALEVVRRQRDAAVVALCIMSFAALVADSSYPASERSLRDMDAALPVASPDEMDDPRPQWVCWQPSMLFMPIDRYPRYFWGIAPAPFVDHHHQALCPRSCANPWGQSSFPPSFVDAGFSALR